MGVCVCVCMYVCVCVCGWVGGCVGVPLKALFLVSIISNTEINIYLLARHNSGELCCHATALVLYSYADLATDGFFLLYWLNLITVSLSFI